MHSPYTADIENEAVHAASFQLLVVTCCTCLNMIVPVLTCGASCQVACTRCMGLCSIHYSQQLLGCPKDCSAADGHRRHCTITASSCHMALYTSLRYGVVVALSNHSYICICIHMLNCASELEQRIQTNMASIHAHVHFYREHDMQAPSPSMQAGCWTLVYKMLCQPSFALSCCIVLLMYILLLCYNGDIACLYAGLGYNGAALATSISFWLQFFFLIVWIVLFKVMLPANVASGWLNETLLGRIMSVFTAGQTVLSSLCHPSEALPKRDDLLDLF